MINRWQGNTGRVQRLPETGEQRSTGRSPAPEFRHTPPRENMRPMPAPPRKPGGILQSLEGLKNLLPGKAEELETEDIILLLILYLMYRESGDAELLMIMGAMFLL